MTSGTDDQWGSGPASISIWTYEMWNWRTENQAHTKNIYIFQHGTVYIYKPVHLRIKLQSTISSSLANSSLLSCGIRNNLLYNGTILIVCWWCLILFYTISYMCIIIWSDLRVSCKEVKMIALLFAGNTTYPFQFQKIHSKIMGGC